MADAQRLAAHQAGQTVARDRSGRVAVIDLAGGGRRDGQRLGGDVGRAGVGADGVVVGESVGAVLDREIGQGDGDATGGDILAGEDGAGPGRGHVFGNNRLRAVDVHRPAGEAGQRIGGDGGFGVAVIDLVARHRRHGQGALVDGAGRSGQAGDGVVAGCRASERDAGHGDGLAGAGVGVGKVGGGAGDADGIRRAADRHHAVQGAARVDACRRAGIVGLPGDDNVPGQFLGRDLGQGGFAVGDRIVACVATGQGDAADRHRLGGGHRLAIDGGIGHIP